MSTGQVSSLAVPSETVAADGPVKVSAMIASKLERDSEYYSEEKMSIFSVDGTLFRLPRSLLTSESSVFHDMFSCPPGDQIEEGESDSNPIFVPSTPRNEFRALLRFLHARKYDDKPPLTLPQWCDLLRISTRFQFERIRMCAISEIANADPKLDPLDELLLSRECNVKEWLYPALTRLVVRDQTLSTSEAERVPLDVLIRLWGAHKDYHAVPKQCSHCGNDSYPSNNNDQAANHITVHFKYSEFVQY